MKAYIQTYGCQMNEHDSQRMEEVIREHGYALADNPEDASLILLNTCSVRHNPENKVYSFLGAVRDLKLKNPDLVIAVGGCVAQQEGNAILKREKAVDIVFGPDNMFRLPEMIDAARNGERVLMTKWEKRPADRIRNFVPEEYLDAGHVEGCKAYIAITKGCDNFCTFCIVPYTRGREISREAGNVVHEARSLVAKGAKEIWLLGQNVNSYRAGDHGFYELLDAVSQVEGLERVRFTSPYPNDWNNALSDLMAERKTICNQLHLPYQSGSNRLLQAMNRQHTIEEYLEKISYMRSINPTLELSTDLIVGFPGETDQDFLGTLRVLRECQFGQVFPFKYSPRPGTKASDLEDDVPRDLKEDRLAQVIALQNEINAERIQRYVGTEQEVLIESANRRQRGVMNGRTDGYRPAAINDATLNIGDLVTVHVTRAESHWLYGEPVVATTSLS